jgi:hypothetical protein
LRRTDKNFTDFAKNGVFQQYQPRVTDAAMAMNVCYEGTAIIVLSLD